MSFFFGVGYLWGVVECAEIGSLCEALGRCGGCGMGGGKVWMARGVCVVWLVLYG